ncbi:Formate--tetrahydrofolate ligase [Caenispirillum salinarum AK4]|uniref:Formate--tetrahydrofolate ligase n=1 Tax=Caenispirillum salinarum AK4 TaxID=1238182 RepID=K9GQN2_9PROT|nr:formate--tetrahydrofolate ligase [Caenispirillum salinarum]EKV27039.1 Formate--tetrahydrofolate ligase [Caenispirillum salinarum AK4]
MTRPTAVHHHADVAAHPARVADRPRSDLEIARAAPLKPIAEVATDRLGLTADDLIPYGRHKAKLDLDRVADLASAPRGRLVLVTAITPTPAGEGKTTTTVGLGDGLNAIGKRAAVCLREPSLGPCFGMKGGATGGGRAQVAPIDEINLHFTGDFHAVTSAHNLLSALLDNSLHWGNPLDIDTRRVTWKRVADMNDRALRHIVAGLGGPAQGVPREDGFDITVASEVMAILCLSTGLDDLQRRLGDIIVGRARDGRPVRARDVGADGAMACLLRDAMAPNLVQSLEHNPAFIHGGPFANIAHGCNSVLATRTASALADVTVTEAGFGADLGAEKFLHIKCRQSGLRPDAAVLVATVRALKMHGGVGKDALGIPDPQAVRAGGANLARHVGNMQRFGLPLVVALNRFSGDTEAEVAAVRALCDTAGVPLVVADHWASGGGGAVALAEAVDALTQEPTPEPRFLYEESLPLAEKIEAVATGLYGAAGVVIEPKVLRQLQEFEALGYGRLPVCIAKTQYSFSADPSAKGAPDGHMLPVREVRLAAGAGFVVAVCGDIMTMPGLPRQPAALRMHLNTAGHVDGF